MHILIFANGEVNDGPMVRRVLAEPFALVMAADGGARMAAHFGLTPQLVIGDMDSLDDEAQTRLADSGTALERFPVHKNETDLELALMRAVERGAQSITVIGALGGRLDQTLSNIYLLALPALRGVDVRLVAGNQQAWLVYPGEDSVEGEPGDTVSLIPLGGVARGVRTDGLYYPLVNEDLLFGPARGVSNVLTEQVGRLWLADGVLLVVHTLGKA